MALRIRRGTDADRLLVTPLEGELIYTTDTKALYIGDGITLGGIKMGPVEISDVELVNETTPTLGGNLNLNGYNIVGSGNINIDGAITATGNINLGNGVEDNVIIGGVISSSLIPDADNQYDLGDPLTSWRFGHFSEVFADNVETTSISVDRISSLDSTLLYNAGTRQFFANEFVGNLVGNVTGNIAGDFVGSIFADDSTLLVDGVNARITGLIETSSAVINSPTGTAIEITHNTLNTGINILAETSSRSGGNITAGSYRIGLGGEQTVLQVGDVLGQFRMSGLVTTPVGDEITSLALVQSVLLEQGDGVSVLPKAQIELRCLNGPNPANASVASFNNEGTFAAPVIKTGVYENETARDAAIPNPVAGMIILLNSHDDSTGPGPVFQGYNGLGWVDLF